MDELELSLLTHGPDVARVLRPWLDRFETERRIHIETIVFEWEEAWPELVKASIYGHGPDISELGSTWTSSLIAMNELLPFKARELDNIGGVSAFLPSVWQPSLDAGDGKIWALPWLAYTRLIYFRRDLLDKAGIDELTAFQTHEQFEKTLEHLIRKGVTTPWCVPTRHSRDTLHNIASWIWSAGGEFVSEDGKHILFNEKEARAGMRAYFDLYRYMSQPARHLDESDNLFKQGQAAIVMSGPWLWPLDPHRPDVTPDVARNVGVAVPLQTAFVGFSYLAIWRYTRHQVNAIKLVFELTKPDNLDAFALRTGGPLSVRLDSLEHSPLAGEANYKTMVRALKTGRTVPQIALWGLLEEKLVLALDSIWEDVLAESHPDVDTILGRHLDPLARRLELTLASR